MSHMSPCLWKSFGRTSQTLDTLGLLASVGLGFGRRATLMRRFIKYRLAAPLWMRRTALRVVVNRTSSVFDWFEID